MGGDQGYMWRKYGEKSIASKKIRIRRSYYRCVTTHSSCPARKRVDRLASAGTDAPPLSVSMVHRHNHPPRLPGAFGLSCSLNAEGISHLSAAVEEVPLSPVVAGMPAENLAQEMVKDLEMQMLEGHTFAGSWGEGEEEAGSVEKGADMGHTAAGSTYTLTDAEELSMFGESSPKGQDSVKGGDRSASAGGWAAQSTDFQHSRQTDFQHCAGSGIELEQAKGGKGERVNQPWDFEYFCQKSRDARGQGDTAEKLLMGLLGMSSSSPTGVSPPTPAPATSEQHSASTFQCHQDSIFQQPEFNPTAWTKSLSEESLTSPSDLEFLSPELAFPTEDWQSAPMSGAEYSLLSQASLCSTSNGGDVGTPLQCAEMLSMPNTKPTPSGGLRGSRRGGYILQLLLRALLVELTGET